MLDTDWICKNWNFLEARWMKRINANHLHRLYRDGSAPTTGRFYGTPEFFDLHSSMGAVTHTGSKKLCLRPYVVAPMPNTTVKAVFIDPKKYEFDEAGNIKGQKSLYDVPVYVFIGDE